MLLKIAIFILCIVFLLEIFLAHKHDNVNYKTKKVSIKFNQFNECGKSISKSVRLLFLKQFYFIIIILFNVN